MGTANQAKKAEKKVNHARWKARMWGREVFNKRMEVALPVSGSTSGADVLKKQLRSIGKTFAMMYDTEIRDVVQSTNLRTNNF